MTRLYRKWLRFRLGALFALFFLFFVALTSRAFQLQILAGQTLKNIAVKQHTKTLQLQPERGIIFDRNGEKLAVSVAADSVCADPAKVAQPATAARQLAAVLDTDAAAFSKRLTGSKHFCWIARRISADQAARVEHLDIDGIFLVKEPKRHYPNGEMAGHVLGFVGTDAVGLEGLELKYDRYLKGAPEKLTIVRDAKGKVMAPRTERADKAIAGREDSNNLILTIDGRLQYLVESKLKEAVRAKGAKGGMAIVMDPRTGEILAMATEPAFNPNTATKSHAERMKNKIITDCFDPGSTFKPFLAGGALEEGVVKETDVFYCENGSYVVADRVFHEANRQKHGRLTFSEILKYSSNIGSVKVSERLGKEKFHEYITRFGFGSRTGIDLPGESPGLLRPVRSWTRVDTSTAAFGQGVSVTAIQLITALSAIANGGILMKPYVVQGVVDKNGQVVKKFVPTVVRRVLSPETSARLTAILTNVVQDQDGTGKNARLVNVAVAGKTGTSQKFDFSRRKYSSERVRTSFMGFFPAQDAQVAILVTLDEPQRDKWGGMAAAPVFRNIGEQILTTIRTDIRETPSLPAETERPIEEVNLRLVRAPQVETDFSTPASDSATPNFLGMTMREALKTAKQNRIELKMAGSGWAVRQRPAPGTPVGDLRICSVSFSRED
ncbi:MAG TPA: penicillin-binding transpeptidase domain-containing protein [Syntrophales bacterium]|nr:penicillin-binding transpeptidase domain-containing protein [Syntrophales bacterium]